MRVYPLSIGADETSLIPLSPPDIDSLVGIGCVRHHIYPMHGSHQGVDYFFQLVHSVSRVFGVPVPIEGDEMVNLSLQGRPLLLCKELYSNSPFAATALNYPSVFHFGKDLVYGVLLFLSVLRE